MSYRASGRSRRLVAAGASLAALVATVVPAAAANAAGAGKVPSLPKHPSPSRAALLAAAQGSRPASVGGGNAASEPGRQLSTFPTHGSVTVMLELDAAPSALSFHARLSTSKAAAAHAALAERAHVDALASSVESHLGAAATRATVLFRVHTLYAGVAVRTDASRIGALSRLPGVKAVHLMPTKHVSNVSTVPLIGGPTGWSTYGDTGTGARIGIIDTGIDYTHANFGGPGTTSAFADAFANDTKPINPAYIDRAKVAGGIDLVGDDYNADPSSPSYDPVPKPDPNPLDCYGHGSHVAGSAAGFGVTSDGKTFTGDYSTLASDPNYSSEFRIGPGVAPGAKLYAIRVFGCEGSTNVVSAGLDWAADPNGDGDPSDHLDVVNMSLGSDYGAPDDPDAVASNNASLLGITVVAASGNAGDLFDVGGSPGNATRAIAVAASDDALTVMDALRVDSPADIAGQYPGQESVAYDWAGNGPTSGTLAPVDPSFDPSATGAWDPTTMSQTNADGCDPFTADQAAAVKGKIAWEEWTDDSSLRRCGSAKRSGNAKAAGAIGVVFSDDEDLFAAGITGDPDIPVFQVTKSASDAIRPELAGGVQVTLSHEFHNSQQANHPENVDKVAGFSSRGVTDATAIKPDVTAPGVTVFSTSIGTGNEGETESGTSMATPHVAGEAALVKAAHPDWTPEQVKADIMNTADEDLYTGDNHTGNVYAPNRVGAGRVDVPPALANPVLAYNQNDAGAVSVSFGTVDVSGPTQLTKSVVVQNTSDTDETYAVSYDGIDQMGGAQFSVSPSSVDVPAHGTRNVTVTLTVDGPDALGRPLDPTTPSDSPYGVLRDFVSDISGRVLLAPSDATLPTLRVPVYAAPRPTSAMSAAPVQLAPPTSAVSTGELDFSGRGLDTGFANYISATQALELQGTSPRQPDCAVSTASNCVPFASERAADLRRVGVGSDVPFAPSDTDPYASTSNGGGYAYFGVQTWGDWSTAASYVEFDVNIDTDGDGEPDAILFNTRLPDTDVLVSELYDVEKNDITDIELLNGFDATVDTRTFDSNVMVMPVALNALPGISAAHTRLTYTVDASTAEEGLRDSISTPMAFDLAHPGLAAGDGWSGAETSNQLYPDYDGLQLTVLKDATDYARQHPKGLLVFHFLNGESTRGQVVPVTQAKAASATKLGLSHTKVGYSAPVTATVTVTSALAGVTPRGSVQLLVNGTVRKTASLSGGVAHVALPRLVPGSYHVTARYLGDAVHTASTSGSVTLTVVKESTQVSVSVAKNPVHHLTKDTITATVSPRYAATATPTGKVAFYINGVHYYTVTLKRGVATMTETHAPRGSDVVKAVYLGSANANGSHGYRTFRVI